MKTYTEEQVSGYIVLALKKLGKDDKEIRETVYEVKERMDFWTEEYAEEVHDDFFLP